MTIYLDAFALLDTLVAQPASAFYLKTEWGNVGVGVRTVPAKANIVSSLRVNKRHIPVLDLDIAHTLEKIDYNNLNAVRFFHRDLTDDEVTTLRSVGEPFGIQPVQFRAGFFLVLTAPAYYIPSRTLGHGHLYILRDGTWSQYRRLLVALAEVGVLQPRFVQMALDRRQTCVMKPGLMKPDEASSSNDNQS